MFDATTLDFTQPKTRSIASLLVECRFNHSISLHSILLPPNKIYLIYFTVNKKIVPLQKIKTPLG